MVERGARSGRLTEREVRLLSGNADVIMRLLGVTAEVSVNNWANVEAGKNRLFYYFLLSFLLFRLVCLPHTCPM